MWAVAGAEAAARIESKGGTVGEQVGRPPVSGGAAVVAAVAATASLWGAGGKELAGWLSGY